jgi:glyoxylase I family protein
VAPVAVIRPRYTRLGGGHLSAVRPFHHVDLVVASLERSLPFYRELLGPLGFTHESTIVGERGEPVHYIGSEDADLGLRERTADRPVDRYALGLHHLAFGAPSREVVDERAAWLRAAGAAIESGPREYDYSPGYYAVFFADPDGLKLEIVHQP